MSFIKSLLISCAAVLLLVMAGCQSYDNVIVAEVLQQGINEKIYTACNLWYTNKDDISCLNIQSGTFIPIGTQIIPVEAIADSRGGKLTFKDVKGTTYTINFVAGLRLMSMQDYIEQIFTKKSLNEQLKDVSKQDLTYSGMLGQLSKMANSMKNRTSTGEKLSNAWENVQYTMATQMANDPILYLLPRVATLLEDYAGGIDLPAIHVAGFGIDLNTSVAQLMNVAALSGSILGSLGPMITGLASATSGSAMLGLAGINTSGQAPVIARGSAQPLQHLGGSSISESGLVGNASGDDVKNATLQDAEDSKKKQMVEAKEEEPTDDLSTKSQQAVIDIYNLLEEVAHGSQSLRVRLISEGFEKDNGNWVLSI
jgi:hypothetical protein